MAFPSCWRRKPARLKKASSLLPAPSQGPLATYRAFIADGRLKNDPAQYLAAEQLQLLADHLADRDSAAWMRVLDLLPGRRRPEPRGLYLFGDVGRGKTMLMDLFYENVEFSGKKRQHFHPFMRKVHALIKSKRHLETADPLKLVAREILQDTRLLCLDELHVNDIADAMILARLFDYLFRQGLILVATSNVPPSKLYENGLNRQLFLPFVALLESRMQILQLEAQRDYRRDGFQETPHYLTPADEHARRNMDAIWRRLAGGVPPHDGELKIGERRIAIPCMGGGMVRFSFGDLCDAPLGAGDYLALCEHFHTFFLDDVPQLSQEQYNASRRFMVLVDTLYDQRRRLVMSCMVEPDEIYTHGPGADEFARTASRLTEMRQSTWPDEPSGPGVTNRP